MNSEQSVSESLALSFFGIAVVACAVLSAFSVRIRWRVAILAIASLVWGLWTGLRGEVPWPETFQLRSLVLLAAVLLSVTSQRFISAFPAVLVLWFFGAGIEWQTFGDGVRDLHGLLVVATAGVGWAGFFRLAGSAWMTRAELPTEGLSELSAWKAVARATAVLLVALVLTLAYELTYREAPLGLQEPIGLMAALAESVAAICLWRAVVQTSQLDHNVLANRQGIEPALRRTLVGLMAVFVLTASALTTIPVLAFAR